MLPLTVYLFHNVLTIQDPLFRNASMYLNIFNTHGLLLSPPSFEIWTPNYKPEMTHPLYPSSNVSRHSSLPHIESAGFVLILENLIDNSVNSNKVVAYDMAMDVEIQRLRLDLQMLTAMLLTVNSALWPCSNMAVSLASFKWKYESKDDDLDSKDHMLSFTSCSNRNLPNGPLALAIMETKTELLEYNFVLPFLLLL